ncbi:hypothetical protein [Thermodesulfovibrio sp. 3462-1]|uniref:OB domain-containing protein n=1 Tax=Thermodesulfovibrio obliviosus TaxID=3118332 RepID=A0AAU8H2M2_9BACT
MANLREILEQRKAERIKNTTLFWRPIIGDVMEGTVVDIGSVITSLGESNYIDVMTDTGEIVTIWLNTVLQALVEKEKVKKGDRIAVEYLGVRSKNKKIAHKEYVIAVEHTS